MLVVLVVHLLLGSLKVWVRLLCLLSEVDLTVVAMVERRGILTCKVGNQSTVRVLVMEKRVVTC